MWLLTDPKAPSDDEDPILAGDDTTAPEDPLFPCESKAQHAQQEAAALQGGPLMVRPGIVHRLDMGTTGAFSPRVAADVTSNGADVAVVASYIAELTAVHCRT